MTYINDFRIGGAGGICPPGAGCHRSVRPLHREPLSQLKIKTKLEVPVGFEPTNGGFANRSVRPLHHGTLP